MHSEAFFEDSPKSWLTEQKWVDRFNEANPRAVTYCDPSRLSRFRNAVSYPFDDVLKSLPFAYLENSVAYMIALAIIEGRRTIGLFGVHMFAGPEAQISQPSVAYLVGLAQGRGIEIVIPPGSPLFMSNYVAGRYGVRGGKEQYRPKIICYAGVTPYE